jgi:UrcA family protein
MTSEEFGGSMEFKALKSVGAGAAALLLAGAIAGFMPVAASAAEQLKTTVVRASDLKLDTAKGQRILQRRTAWAIDRVCPMPGSVLDSRSGSTVSYQECAQSVRNSVQQQLQQRGIQSAANLR